MKNTKIAALVAGALVAGLVLGGIGIAAAAQRVTTAPAVSTQGAGTYGGASGVAAALAGLTGLTTDQVLAEHVSGVSFATIATENGVDPATLVGQVVTDRAAQLDALVAAGTITQAQEDSLLAALTSRIKAVVDMTPGAGSDPTTSSAPATGTVGPRGLHHGGRRMGMSNRGPSHMAQRMMAPGAPAAAVDPSSASGTAHRAVHASMGMGGSGTNMGSGRGMH